MARGFTDRAGGLGAVPGRRHPALIRPVGSSWHAIPRTCSECALTRGAKFLAGGFVPRSGPREAKVTVRARSSTSSSSGRTKRTSCHGSNRWRSQGGWSALRTGRDQAAPLIKTLSWWKGTCVVIGDSRADHVHACSCRLTSSRRRSTHWLTVVPPFWKSARRFFWLREAMYGSRPLVDTARTPGESGPPRCDAVQRRRSHGL